MKLNLSTIIFTLVALFGLCTAFEKEDHEIFRLRDEVIESEGPDATFYSFLNVSQTASKDAIDKAYRVRSKRLHPDKAIRDEVSRRNARKKKNAYDPKKKPGVNVQKGISQKERAQIAREANERYARLTNVANALRGPMRDRYDHFLKNGFPIWRGTGYYYNRLRPGLGSVLFGLLIVFGGGAHYGAMYISWKRQREFVQRYINHARKMAWGNDTGIPGLPSLENITNPAVPSQSGPAEDEPAVALNRKQKRMQERENRKKEIRGAVKGAKTNGISRPVNAENISNGPQGSRKKVIAENGKVLIVDSVGNVFLEDDTEEGEVHEFLLDPEEIPKPTIYQTALFRMPIFLYAQSIGRVVDKVRGVSKAQDEPFLDEDAAELTMEVNPEKNEDAVFQTATSPNVASEIKKRKSKGKS